MAKRRETRWEHFRDTLRFVALPSWKIGFALIPVILLAWVMWFWATRPSLTQTGEIVHFSPHASKFRADRIAIVVRSSDGSVTELLPKASDAARCRTGDRITYTTGPNGLWIDRCDHPSP